MTTRVIETEGDLASLNLLLAGYGRPFTISISAGKKRSTEQNRLGRALINIISEQLGDRPPEEVRGECKLTIGVPILRAASDLYMHDYDEVLKPLDTELKIKLMQEPFDMAVTRRMTVKQKTEYLDGIMKEYGYRGVVFTELNK